jgi:hypothetical protein
VTYGQDVNYPEIIEVPVRVPSPSGADIDAALSVADFPSADAADAFISLDVRDADSCSKGTPPELHDPASCTPERSLRAERPRVSLSTRRLGSLYGEASPGCCNDTADRRGRPSLEVRRCASYTRGTGILASL